MYMWQRTPKIFEQSLIALVAIQRHLLGRHLSEPYTQRPFTDRVDEYNTAGHA